MSGSPERSVRNILVSSRLDSENHVLGIPVNLGPHLYHFLGFGTQIRDILIRHACGRFPVGELVPHTDVLDSHAHEGSSRPDTLVKQRIILTGVPVQVEYLGHGRVDAGRRPVDFHILLDGRPQRVHFLEVHVVAASMSVALEEQGGLVDTVDDPVTGNTLGVTGNAGKGGVEVADEHHVAGD